MADTSDFLCPVYFVLPETKADFVPTIFLRINQLVAKSDDIIDHVQQSTICKFHLVEVPVDPSDLNKFSLWFLPWIKKTLCSI